MASRGTSFATLYASGDIILTNPIESSTIFLLVVFGSACIEYLFGLAREVESKFFRVMLDAINEEVLVVGILSLLLTFGSSVLRSLPDQWLVMFEWAHMCLFFMAIMFIVLVCSLLLAVFTGHRTWKKFETSRMKNPNEQVSGREQKFRLAWGKFQLALKAFGFRTDVSFSWYLLKTEKEILFLLTDLSWKSWLALSTIVILNALRTKLVPTEDTDANKLINIVTFVAFCGYGTLGLFLWLHFRLQHRFRQYLLLNSGKGRSDEGNIASELSATKADLDDPRSFLVWQNINGTISVLQATLMFLVWYSSVFFLNLVYEAFALNFLLAIAITATAMLPLCVWVVMCPWTLLTITTLSSLGINLDEVIVRGLELGHTDQQEEEAKQKEKAKQKRSATDIELVENLTVMQRPLRPILLDGTRDETRLKPIGPGSASPVGINPAGGLSFSPARPLPPSGGFSSVPIPPQSAVGAPSRRPPPIATSL
jgi:hypothetical protein